MEQNVDGTVTTLAIIVSELVSNAVLHGAEPVELTLRSELDEITLEVADGDPAVNDVRSPAVNERTIGGKGLLIVASLADRWGIRPSPPGKTVWATVHRALA
jgi:anti-sigma regulatory factor (Ser/Thr protein kinase)